MDFEALSHKLANAKKVKKMETVSEAVSTSLQNGNKNALINVLSEQKARIEKEKGNSDDLARELEEMTLILSNEDAKKVNDKLTDARKQLKAVEYLRKEITRPVDDFKRGLMAVEKSCNERLVNAIEALNSNLNKYNAEQERKAEIERQRIEKERLKRLEAERIQNQILSNIEGNIIKFAERYKDAIYAAFNNITLENYQLKEKALIAVKPKFHIDNYNELFHVFYNELSRSELELIIDKLKSKFPYPAINEKYISLVEPTINEHIKKLPQKLLSLKMEAEMEKENKAEAERLRKEREAKQEEQEKERQLQRLLEEKRRKEAEEKAKADAILRTELQAQSQVQSISAPTRKVKYQAVISENADAKALFNAAINAGYKTKELLNLLQKMGDFLANGEKPEIKGVSYKVK